MYWCRVKSVTAYCISCNSMKQMSLFSFPEKSNPEKPHNNPPHLSADVVKWQLFVDGAARNNPGPAGAGIYILKNGTPFIKQGFYLGSKTNNQAEYLALVLGLCQLRSVMKPADF